MKITFFGLPGTGTSTAGKLLAKKLGYEYGYTGQMFRDKAKSLGLTIYEFDELQKDNPQYDKEIDDSVGEFGKNNDDFIFEGRIAWRVIPDSIKILFVCDEKEAMRRIAEREGISIEEATKITKEREENIGSRYRICYPGIDYPPREDRFDLIIDTTNIPPDEIVDKIIGFVNSKKE